MDDLISRQAAIEYFMTNTNWHDEDGYEIHDAEDKRALLESYFDGVPSAQPEPSTEIQEILNYLDTTLHPIVSPNNWNVYAELHDMVSRLPSAQPEQNDKPFSEMIHGMFDHIWDCQIDHPVFQDTVGDLMMAVIQCHKTLTEEKPEQRWIPVSERLPEEGEDVLVTIFFHGLTVKYKNGRIDHIKPNYYIAIASRIDGEWISDSADYKAGKHEVIAWMPLPKSFREKKDG